MKNAFLALWITVSAFSLYASDKEWRRYRENVLSKQTSFEGWCSPEKAKRMMDLIYKTKPKVCVEVGVFGGASIYPTASALKFLHKGQVYAIDPWENAPCLDGYRTDDPNYQWWNTVDLEKIYQGFEQMLNHYRLKRYCVVMRMTGMKALEHFTDESIDILHIDGNHTENAALSDAEMYLPKVKKGGYIWFDDANWETTLPARTFLMLNCVKDESRSTSEYFLFRK
jgi:predicted O-methyltransferase YrrM